MSRKYKDIDQEGINNIDELMKDSDPLSLDSADDELEMPKLDLDLNQVETDTANQAKNIVERLSGYYFDPKYIEKHPYITCKIQTEIQNIRRLLKMLTINEKAQDSIIMGIALSMTKSTLYQSLTSLQNSTLSIQKQLDDVVCKLEDIFRLMQEECEKTFEEKDKETASDGTIMVKGSKEFIEEMTAILNNRKVKKQLSEDNQQQIS